MDTNDTFLFFCVLAVFCKFKVESQADRIGVTVQRLKNVYYVDVKHNQTAVQSKESIFYLPLTLPLALPEKSLVKKVSYLVCAKGSLVDICHVSNKKRELHLD